MKTTQRSARPRQRGVILIAALAMLLMLTLLAVGMFRSFGLEERITGNSREKQRAFFAAQSALQYAEGWLAGGAAPQAKACTAASPVPQVCTPASLPSAQQMATDTSWTCNFATPFIPASLTAANGTTQQQVSADTTCAGGSAQGNFFEAPQYVISYLGSDPTATGSLYQVTSLGYGGNANSVAVVQSVYFVGSGTTVVSK